MALGGPILTPKWGFYGNMIEQFGVKKFKQTNEDG